MDPINDDPPTRRRLPRTVLWSLGAIAATAIAVEATRTGTDVLVLVLACVGIVMIERTVGDWMGELIGSGLTTIILGSALAFAAYLSFAPGGVAQRFFEAAGQRGYGTVYYQAPAPASAASTVGPSENLSAPADSGSFSAAPSRSGSPGSPVATGSSGVESSPAEPPDEAGTPVGSRLPAARTDEPARRAPSATYLQLPDVGLTNEQIVVRVRAVADGQPVAGGVVEFRLNGRAIGSSTTGSDGTASTSFRVRAPGRFQVSAELAAGESYFGSSRTSTINVLPGRS